MRQTPTVNKSTHTDSFRQKNDADDDDINLNSVIKNVMVKKTFSW